MANAVFLFFFDQEAGKGFQAPPGWNQIELGKKRGLGGSGNGVRFCQPVIPFPIFDPPSHLDQRGRACVIQESMMMLILLRQDPTELRSQLDRG